MKKQKTVWDYLWYALYAFMGLGLEIVLLAVIEPLLFGGVKSSEYSDVQTIVHWLLTIICWGTLAILLVQNAKKYLFFDVMKNTNPSRKGIAISAILVLVCILLNAFDWGTLKIIGEFQKKGLLLFLFQYIYYLFEVALVYLIIVFGHKFFERITKKTNYIPWGGIVLSFTWGAIHFFSKGSIFDGVGVMIFALLYGEIYLLLNRNAKASYLAIALAFII